MGGESGTVPSRAGQRTCGVDYGSFVLGVASGFRINTALQMAAVGTFASSSFPEAPGR